MKLSLSAILSAIVLTVVGCSYLQDFYGSNDRAFDSTVRIASTATIDNKPERAQEMARIAGITKSWTTDVNAPITELDSMIRAEINWSKYDPDEQIIIDEFLRFLKAELEARIQSHEIEADHKVLVSHMADLILEVTQRYL